MPLSHYSIPSRCLRRLQVFCVAAIVALGAGVGPAQEPAKEVPSAPADQKVDAGAETAQSVDFARDVFPILKQHCLECHGPDEQEGDLRVDQSDILLSEDFVTPGDASDSLLHDVLISEDEEERMPPAEEGPPLPANEIDVIKSWIDQGAKWVDISAQLPAPATETSDPTENGNQPQPLTPQATFWLRVWRAFGDCHPAIVHFPIALLVVGGLFALFGLRGSYRCSDFAFYCLWLGALTAILASVVGWSFAWNEGHNEDPFAFDQTAELFWHRWTGVLLSILAFLVAVWATIARRRDPEDGTAWKLCLILLAGFTMYVGHAGGDLTHRRGYRRLFELFGIQAPANPGNPNQGEQSPGDKDP